ncbi:MAG: hypothetical protein NTX25_15350, partial [Proteobacteria bacterium]|nr:hypothetical protein [Pseudomonadota bacterium]
MTRPAFCPIIWLIFCLALPFMQACRFFQAEANVQIKVLDTSGDPVSAAQVVIHKVLRGQTDGQGALTLSLELPVEEPILVEINKPSADVFFAPYFGSIRLSRGEPNLFKIRATLYAVPKNSRDKSGETAPQLASQGIPVATSSKSAQETAASFASMFGLQYKIDENLYHAPPQAYLNVIQSLKEDISTV